MCWGGDVAKFAGDALLCVWRVDKYLEGASASLEQALKQGELSLTREGTDLKARLARRAAFEMLVAIEEPNFKGLKVHGGIGSGELLSIHLEGDRSGDGLPSRWHLGESWYEYGCELPMNSDVQLRARLAYKPTTC